MLSDASAMQYSTHTSDSDMQDKWFGSSFTNQVTESFGRAF